MKRSLLVLSLLGGAVAFAPILDATPALAKPSPSSKVRKRLARGKALFRDQEYRKAIRVLAPLRRDSRATRAQRLRALELIGLSYLIVGDRRRAREAFQDLLAIDPGYQLRDDTGSPKIRRFFDRVKRDYVPGFDAKAVAELEHSAPSGANAGRRLELDVTIKKGEAKVREVVAKLRRRGVLGYGLTANFRKRKGNTWRAKLVPPASTDGYVLEYYLEARDGTGKALGRVAGPETPLSIPVAPGSPRRKTRWYKRWYFVAGGAAVLGLGAALLITSGGGTPDGTLPPGRITLGLRGRL